MPERTVIACYERTSSDFVGYYAGLTAEGVQSVRKYKFTPQRSDAFVFVPPHASDPNEVAKHIADALNYTAFPMAEDAPLLPDDLVDCPDCDGTGVKASLGGDHGCDECGGKARITVRQRDAISVRMDVARGMLDALRDLQVRVGATHEGEVIRLAVSHYRALVEVAEQGCEVYVHKDGAVVQRLVVLPLQSKTPAPADPQFGTGILERLHRAFVRHKKGV